MHFRGVLKVANVICDTTLMNLNCVLSLSFPVDYNTRQNKSPSLVRQIMHFLNPFKLTESLLHSHQIINVILTCIIFKHK